MRTLRKMALAGLTVTVTTSLAGCGLFSGSGISGKYKPNDPDRTADRVVAAITNTTYFTADALSDKAAFRATLYDKDGRQFFGPTVQLNGDSVPPVNAGEDRTTVYAKSDLPYAAGDTWSVAVQGNTATTPPAPAPLWITSPAAATDDKGAKLTYFSVEHGQPATITWSGGDPAQPVYIILYGSPDRNAARRLFVSDNPAMSPSDPTNFGKPIPNTGSYTIPAQVTERVVGGDGATTTRTVTLFDNQNKAGKDANIISISVLQRGETVSGPIHFAVTTVGAAAAGTPAYK